MPRDRRLGRTGRAEHRLRPAGRARRVRPEEDVVRAARPAIGVAGAAATSAGNCPSPASSSRNATSPSVQKYSRSSAVAPCGIGTTWAPSRAAPSAAIIHSGRLRNAMPSRRSRPDPRAAQHVAVPGHGRVDLRVGDPPLAGHDRDRVRLQARVRGQPVLLEHLVHAVRSSIESSESRVTGRRRRARGPGPARGGRARRGRPPPDPTARPCRRAARAASRRPPR